MKKMKLSLLAVALMVVTAASAQVSFGIQGGVNLSNIQEQGSNPKVGFNVGVLTDFGLTHNIGIRSGLSFHTKGANAESDRVFSRTNLMYLQIPVHFAYKIDVMPGTRVVLHAGPYVAYGVGGSHTINPNYSGENPDLSVFGSGDTQLKPFDFGLGLGVGFEFGRFLTGIGWDMGLLNIASIEGGTARNMNAHLTVGFRF